VCYAVRPALSSPLDVKTEQTAPPVPRGTIGRGSRSLQASGDRPSHAGGSQTTVLGHKRLPRRNPCLGRRSLPCLSPAPPCDRSLPPSCLLRTPRRSRTITAKVRRRAACRSATPFLPTRTETQPPSRRRATSAAGGSPHRTFAARPSTAADPPPKTFCTPAEVTRRFKRSSGTPRLR